MSSEDTRDLPRTNSSALGWIGIVVLVAVAVSSFFAGYNDGALRVALGCAVLAVVFYLNLIRPLVRLRGDRLELVNALSIVSIPLALIERYEVRIVLMIWAGERHFSSAAIGRSVRALKAETRGRSRAAPRGLSALLAPNAAPVGPTTLDVVDSLLEPAIKEARESGTAEPGDVRRTWSWAWVVLLVLLLAAFGWTFTLF